MEKKFQRNIENFFCEKCKFFVEGSGYTNHCPKCLWSKHVDINPGDRSEKCGGMMKPILVEKDGDGYDVVHKCVICGKERRNKILKTDDFDALIKVVNERVQ